MVTVAFTNPIIFQLSLRPGSPAKDIKPIICKRGEIYDIVINFCLKFRPVEPKAQSLRRTFNYKRIVKYIHAPMLSIDAKRYRPLEPDHFYMKDRPITANNPQ